MGVEAGWQGQGQGSAIVDHLVRKARQMAIKKVFVLTRTPEFFMKLDFLPTSKTLLPEKVLKDCGQCPRQHACDEVALEVNLVERMIIKTELV